MNTYSNFLEKKAQLSGNFGFDPLWMPDFLFDFQKHLVTWACHKGRGALFEDCGLGKTPQQLVFAENVVRKTNKPILILTPLAVSHQTVNEANKFGIHAERCADGKHDGKAKILVTNYERLKHFDAKDFDGCVCDESSILKNFDGALRAEITEFMRRMPYRLLCTATAAPNDYIELGTSSEAVGDMGYMDMLSRFFKNDQNSNHPNRLWSGAKGWRFRGHSEMDFWRWVCSWARAIRKPSDLGFSDENFILPPLTRSQHIVESSIKNPEYLFDMPAVGLREERQERRRTINDRCEAVAELVLGRPSSVVWCALNDEGDLLEKMIPNSVQVAGNEPDEKKEESFRAFESGQIKRLVTKSSIAGFGMNWQHCAHQTCFPSHSFEQWYQGIRRSWRFGQKNPVHIDIVTSEGEARVLKNLQRKAEAAETMFKRLIEMMNNALSIQPENTRTKTEEIPLWL